MPVGPRHQMTPRWKALVEARMRELGLNRSDLAKHLEVSRAAVTKLLDQQHVSSLVPKISEFLGIPPPMVESEDDATARINERLNSWTDEQRAKLLELLDVIEKMVS